MNARKQTSTRRDPRSLNPEDLQRWLVQREGLGARICGNGWSFWFKRISRNHIRKLARTYRRSRLRKLRESKVGGRPAK